MLSDVQAWCSRPLDEIYAIVYLDALVVKVREDRSVRNRACYLAIGVTLEGEREVLGIWWRGLTARGALVGMVVGLVSSAGVMAAGLVAGLEPGIPALLLAQPALWSVPLAFATMIAVSLRGSPPSGAASAMLRLHLDETATGAPPRS